MKYDELLRKYTPCPHCGSEDVEPWTRPKKNYPRVICHECSIVWVDSSYDEPLKPISVNNGGDRT